MDLPGVGGQLFNSFRGYFRCVQRSDIDSQPTPESGKTQRWCRANSGFKPVEHREGIPNHSDSHRTKFLAVVSLAYQPHYSLGTEDLRILTLAASGKRSYCGVAVWLAVVADPPAVGALPRGFWPQISLLPGSCIRRSNSGTSIHPGPASRKGTSFVICLFLRLRLPRGGGVLGGGDLVAFLDLPVGPGISHPPLPFLLPLFPATSGGCCSKVAAPPRRPDCSSTPQNSGCIEAPSPLSCTSTPITARRSYFSELLQDTTTVKRRRALRTYEPAHISTHSAPAPCPPFQCHPSYGFSGRTDCPSLRGIEWHLVAPLRCA